MITNTIISGSSRDYYESHVRKMGPGFAATLDALRNPIKVVNTHAVETPKVTAAAPTSSFDSYA